MSNYNASSAVTPNRSTRVEFDLTEQIVVRDAWGGARSGAQIAAAVSANKGSDSQFCQGVRYWPGSKTWTLQPLQERLSQFHEKLPAGLPGDDLYYVLGIRNEIEGTPPSLQKLIDLQKTTLTLGLADFSVMTTRSLPGSLGFEPGESILTGQLDRGDWLYRRRVQSGKSWAPNSPVTVPTAPQNLFAVGSVGVPGLPAANVIMDPQVQSFQSQRADQGYFLRWSVPGTPNQFPDYILNFYFGQYMITVGGDGMIKLLERCRPKLGQPYRWVMRLSFRYCLPGEAIGITHTLLIYPQIGPFGDRYIHFVNNQLDAANVYGPSASTSEITYLADPVTRQGDVDEVGGEHVTKEGPLRLDHRRDIRVAWQISRLLFVSKGTLIDAAWPRRVSQLNGANVPFQTLLRKRLPSQPDGNLGSGYNVIAQFYDAKTTTAYVPGSSPTWNVRYPYPIFTFTGQADPTAKGACEDTPILDGYDVHQDAVTETVAPGMFTATNIKSVGVTGPDFTMTSEKAMVTVNDLANVLSRLKTRGELSTRIVTRMLPLGGTGDPVDVVLLRGYTQRPRHSQIGASDVPSLRAGIERGRRTGAAQSGDYGNYPKGGGGRIALTMTGMWRRLAPDETSIRKAGLWRRYAYDPLAPEITLSGAPSKLRQPWKVTDVIRDLLKQAGFPDAMIHIQDLPLRLWAGVDNLDDLTADFYTDFQSRIERLAHTYLGAAVIFDGNDGDEGAWRLILNPGKPGQTPVFHLQSYPDVDGIPPHLYGAYGLNTGFVVAPLERYVVPPDYNRVICATGPAALAGQRSGRSAAAVSSEKFNWLSYHVPELNTPAPDPDNPHYIGRERLLYHVDPSLMGAGPDAYVDAKRACDLTVRRLFEYCCLAREIRPVQGPLYVILDADYSRWRPLRFGDSVTFDGQTDWFIRSCNPVIDADRGGDGLQMATYELQRTIPLLPPTV